MSLKIVCMTVLLAATASSLAQAQGGPVAWEAWRSARDQDLKALTTSYLAVRDMARLASGAVLYLPGAVPRAQIGWRKEAPAKPWISVSFKEGKVLAATSAGETLNLLGEPSGWTTPEGMVLSAQLGDDAGAYLILRDAQLESFKTFGGLIYFPFDPKAVIHARFEPLAKPRKVQVPTTRERPRDIWLMGVLGFTYQGGRGVLNAYCLDSVPNAAHLFVPFHDATNGAETYAGGRYVEAESTGAHEAVIDFNRAYQPYCARNHVYNCIKVSGKPVEARILAGEKQPDR
jgi:hypothetical protein